MKRHTMFLLIKEKVRANKITSGTEGNFITSDRQSRQEDIVTLNINTPNERTSKHTEQNL